ncbi:MAG TPA: indole-3-glycerol phosphate synthase TrpC [Cyclobacteriaceae bacterium]|nr:indole-3-glycerol phosphate synthase TrpC [Cyclobacteriaceae bacterium]
MNILDTIAAHKKKEVAERQRVVPLHVLEKRELFSRNTHSLKQALLQPRASGIIAEFKRKSPSQGVIHPTAGPDKITVQYVEAGATALSVLTDRYFFGGSDEDFLAARRVNPGIPMLRKEFVLDEYQVIETKSLGADVVLLIAALLAPEEIKSLTSLAHSLGMEVLLEVHTRHELQQNPDAGTDLIGVNNRDLKTFTVSTDVSKQLAPFIPAEIIPVSESGIDTAEAIRELRTYGFRGFLMGQKFMEQPAPGQACRDFIHRLNQPE